LGSEGRKGVSFLIPGESLEFLLIEPA